MSDFGDFEDEDAWDDDSSNADPYQIAIRLHEARAALSELRGEVVQRWDELNDEERAVALAIVFIVMTAMRLEGTRL